MEFTFPSHVFHPDGWLHHFSTQGKEFAIEIAGAPQKGNGRNTHRQNPLAPDPSM
jgi:hypothetical protein